MDSEFGNASPALSDKKAVGGRTVAPLLGRNPYTLFSSPEVLCSFYSRVLFPDVEWFGRHKDGKLVGIVEIRIFHSMDWKKRAMIWQRLTYVEPEDSPWQRWVKGAVEWLTGREKVQRLYRQLQQMEVAHPHDLWGEALGLMDIQYTVYGAAVETIPHDGPLVFIANHPFGIADGLIAADLMGRVRKDFKVMVNRVLMYQDPRMRPYLLPVDFNPGSTALQVNLATRQQALQYLAEGHALVLFPSGGVATAPGGWGQARELPWKRFAAKAVQVAEATVVCAWFYGQNSRWFQLASQCSRSLRLGLLLHELRNKMGTRLHVCLGEPITYASVAHLRNRQQLLAFLQERTEQLGREHNNRM